MEVENFFKFTHFLTSSLTYGTKNSEDDIEFPRCQVITLYYFYKEEDVISS